MSRCPALAALALSAAALPLLGSGVRPAGAAPKRPTISATLSPTRLTGSGGNVSVKVKVTKNSDTVLNSITASVLAQGSRGPVSSTKKLDRSGSYYVATMTVPRNTGTSRRTVYIKVEAGTNAGTTSRLFSLSQDGGSGGGGGGTTTPPPGGGTGNPGTNPNTPPPPPTL
jgi:all-beta uncharacterized protein